MKSKVLRTAALLSSVSIGLFLVFRASAGCGSSEAPTKADADRATSGAPSATSTAAAATGSTTGASTSAAATTTASVDEGQFFPGSKAPGGTGLRPPQPKPTVSVPEEFFGGSKSGPMRPSKGNQANEPMQNVQQGK